MELAVISLVRKDVGEMRHEFSCGSCSDLEEGLNPVENDCRCEVQANWRLECGGYGVNQRLTALFSSIARRTPALQRILAIWRPA